MNLKYMKQAQKQRGMATLVFSLVILFVLTLTTIFGSKVGLLNEKMSSNDFSSKQSMMAAEAGLDAVMQSIASDTSVVCPGGSCTVGHTETITDDIDSTNGVITSYSVETEVIDADPITVKLVATGCVGTVGNASCSATTTNTAIESASTVETYVAKTNKFNFGQAAPMVLAGTLAPSGGWYVVGKSGNNIKSYLETQGKSTSLSGSAAAVSKAPGLISVWSNEDVSSFSGSAATCSLHDFLSSTGENNELRVDDIFNMEKSESLDENGDEMPLPPANKYGIKLCTTNRAISPLGDAPDCYCWNGPTGKGSIPQPAWYNNEPLGLGPDIVAPPVVSTPVANFPTDLFDYVFNTPKASYQQVKDTVDPANTTCSALQSKGAAASGLWWIVGDCTLPDDTAQPNAPIILVIENGQMTFNGSTEAYGLFFVLDTAGTGTASIKTTGGHLYGGAIVDSDAGVSGGNFRLIYSEGVFDSLANLADVSKLSVVPGTWRDWQ